MNLGYVLPPLIAGGIGIVLLAVVLRKGKRRETRFRVFSLLLLSIAAWAFLIFAMRASPDTEHALRWDKAVMPVGFAVCLFYYHFSLTLTGRRRRVLLRAGYLLLAVVIALGPTDLFVQGMEMSYFGYAPVIGPAVIPFVVFTYFLSIMALYNLIKGYRSSLIPEERNRLLYIIIAMVLPLVGGLLDLLPFSYPASIFGNIAFGLLTSIAILRYRLLDIRIVIRRGAAYIIMSAVLATVYGSILVLVMYVSGKEAMPGWIYLILLVVIALTLQPLWGRVQQQVDRWFYRERYDHLKALEQFSRETQSISDPDQLNTTFLRLVSQAMRTAYCFLLLPSPVTGDFSVQSSHGLSKPAPQSNMSGRSPLVQYLRHHEGSAHRRDLDVVPQLQALTAQEKKSLEEIGGELYVPLKVRGELVGILVLGQRLSQPLYSREEERLLVAIANQIAISLQNARLLQETKYSYEQLKAAQGYMVRAERLRALGEMASGIAHNFNNILAAILARAQLALEDVEEGDVKKSLQVIEQAALDGANTIRRLQDYARVRREQAFEPVDLTQLVESTIPIIEPRRRELEEISGVDIAISLVLGKTEPVAGNAGELREVLTNIILNAIDAMPRGGKITLRTRQEDNWAIISVSDTGTGMTAETKSRLFEPFFSTKQRRGSGLGLSVAYGIVTRHGGTIEVESSVGQGSTFSVKLPVAGRVEAKAILPDYSPHARATKILIVDDDERVIDSLRIIVSRLGHKVTAVTTSRAALAAFSQEDYELVITDLGMPEMSGYEIAKAVKRIKPETLVILITGWSAQFSPAKMHEAGIDGIIAKPFTKDSLSAELTRLLKPEERQRRERGDAGVTA